MNRSIAIILALALCPLSTTVIAQSSQPSSETTTNATSTNATSKENSTGSKAANSKQDTSADGLRMAERATFAVRFVTVQPADFLASKLIGATVYNNQNESIGEIEDLVVNNGRAISGVVVSVGGFLGMGDSHVALDPATVVLSQTGDTWRAFVDTNKDNLKNAPKLTYKKTN